MPWYFWAAVVWWVSVSICAVVVTCADKMYAKQGKWRIRERTLFLLAALGGSVAMLITMKKIRHKTLHKSFMIGIPSIIILQGLIIAAVILTLL
ncbi:MAG: DUF1294 domain-containing protein [Oscillospiraceae bacterium]|nr:DUF1294 domain-containing protein [Oscillospiraceae bacterium]